MLTLAIETSGRSGGIAISRGGEPVACVSVSSSETHSRRLVPSIKWLLERAGIAMQELQRIAVSLGPGSFTGIRIGLATARGLSLSLGIPIAGVPTLDVLAAGIAPLPGVLLCPAIDARNRRFYASCYTAEENMSAWRRLLPFQIFTASGLLDCLMQEKLVESHGKQGTASRTALKIMFTGDAVSTCGDELATLFSSHGPVFAPKHLRQPDPSAVAAISARYLQSDTAGGPLPIYVRPSQAEEKKMEMAGASVSTTTPP